MKPWECFVKYPNTVSGLDGQFDKMHEGLQKIYYNYHLTSHKKTNELIEREPKRVVYVQNPKLYNGEYGKKGNDEQTLNDINYFVNGRLNVTDGNFLSGFFISEIQG
jgi:hypothetical protein